MAGSTAIAEVAHTEAPAFAARYPAVRLSPFLVEIP
jgi:hypothetical protein